MSESSGAREWRSGLGKVLRVEQGDITRIEADAIVNAANSQLAGGGGVDGAIHRAAGPEIMRELSAIRAKIGRCPPGDAVVTSAGRLPARFIFHAVGPIYRNGEQGEAEQLASCFRVCLRLAHEHELRSIAFPAISTGVYGYPLEKAAQVAIKEIRSFLGEPGTVEEVRIVLFSPEALRVFARIATI